VPSACVTGIDRDLASASRVRPGWRMAPRQPPLALPRGQRRRQRPRRANGLADRRHACAV